MKNTKIIALTIISLLGLAACGGSNTSVKTSVAESSVSAKASEAASSKASEAPASSAKASEAPASSAPASTPASSEAPASSETPASSEEKASEPVSSEEASAPAESSQAETPDVSVAEDSLLLTFYWNYDGAPDNGIISQTVLKKKRKATVPETPVYDGHYFDNWYADEACTTVFNFDAQLTENTNVYARWLDLYTFEAEYLDFNGRSGNGFSGNANETEMIIKDTKNAGASNGYYVSYLYYNGCYLDFYIDAAEAVDNVVLICRFSAEFYDIDSLSATNYGIYVNGYDEDEEEYMTSCEVTGYNLTIDGTYDVSSSNLRPFDDFLITKTISLNKGENMISLVVENDTNHGGTLHAESPIVDCIKLASTETLSWSTGYPITSNIK